MATTLTPRATAELTTLVAEYDAADAKVTAVLYNETLWTAAAYETTRTELDGLKRAREAVMYRVVLAARSATY